ncbi:MAG: hypothetical protein ACRDBG_13955 [Waterburya sp.]
MRSCRGLCLIAPTFRAAIAWVFSNFIGIAKSSVSKVIFSGTIPTSFNLA